MKNNSTSGFALIEVLIACTLTFIIFASFSYLIKFSMQQAKETSIYLRATSLAHSEMEKIRAESFANIKPYNFDNQKGQVNLRPVYGNLLEIKLLYNWQNGKTPIELYTLRSSL